MKLCLIFLVVGVAFAIGETVKFKGYDETPDDVKSLVDEPQPNDVDESEISDDVRSLIDEPEPDDVDDLENALRKSDIDVGDSNYAVAVKDANGNVKAWWIKPAIGIAKWGIRKIRWGRRRRRKGNNGRRPAPRKRRLWGVNSEGETDEEVSENSLS